MSKCESCDQQRKSIKENQCNSAVPVIPQMFYDTWAAKFCPWFKKRIVRL